MNCPYCGFLNPREAVFCAECGKPILPAEGVGDSSKFKNEEPSVHESLEKIKLGAKTIAKEAAVVGSVALKEIEKKVERGEFERVAVTMAWIIIGSLALSILFMVFFLL